MAQVRVGFMGAVLRGGDPERAWAAFRAMAAADPTQVRRLAETEEGRALLDASRSAWRERGREAPFEFVFKLSAGAAR